MKKTLKCGITATWEVGSHPAGANSTVFSAKFQIKCREFGLDDGESLALWIEDDPQKVRTYFSYLSPSEFQALVDSGKHKLQGVTEINC